MFKGHPKGLIVAFFANMGERFGFYTMMAILVLFLQAKYGLGANDAGIIYSVFYFLIYALALVGGFMADRVTGLSRTISLGIAIMAIGYVLMAIPGMGLVITCLGLFTIAFGNGLFKGNLQAVVGNLYEAPEYSHLRDRAFSLFYMGINVGAIFAPAVAIGVRNWYLSTQGLKYDAHLPEMAHRLIDGGQVTPEFLEKASTAAGTPVTAADALQFANDYINVFSTGFNMAFGVAAISMLASLLVYNLFKKYLKPGMDFNAPATKGDQKVKPADEMPANVVKERISALVLVCLVVIFFWMSFHQNGLTLTLFAKNYTQLTDLSRFTAFVFDIWGLLPAAIALGGIVYALSKGISGAKRVIGVCVAAAAAWLAYLRFMSYTADNSIAPEVFQQFNPIFVVVLTPVVVGFFSYLAKLGKEPSAPRKIGIGMIIASIAFMLMAAGSIFYGQNLPAGLGGQENAAFASPYLLVITYLILTIAELFLSPMGISFVSKVAPPKYKGMMQGVWLCATAIGNQLLFVGTTMWEIFDKVWMVWAIFIVCCLISATVMFAMMRKLERITGNC